VNSGERDDRLNRAQGALLGLAVGDALGTTLEFTARDTKPLVTELVGGGPFGLPPGVWTDDTSMALCLAESLIANSGFNPVDVMNRFVGWWRRGESSPIGRCFDIGTTTASALRRFIDTGEPFAGDPSPQSAGNGSLMRLAPVVVFASGDDAALDRLARQQSRLTHAAPEAIDACALYASLISAALMGGSRHELLSPRPWSGTPAIAASREATGGAKRGHRLRHRATWSTLSKQRYGASNGMTSSRRLSLRRPTSLMMRTRLQPLLGS
jgi:ADP-ribosyl-[dinitrogen reductase] hydrolase